MRLRTFLVLVAGLSFFAAPKVSQAGAMTYLALGDSVAFGETDFTHNPSDGDRGYVSLFADYLATKDGGVRPNVVNLAIEGESTTSFTTGVGRVPFLPGLTDASLASLNSNYAADPLATQSAQMRAEIAKQAAALETPTIATSASRSRSGRSVCRWRLNPKFATLNATQQQATLLALATIQSNYNAILTQIQTLLPHANIIVMGRTTRSPPRRAAPSLRSRAPRSPG